VLTILSDGPMAAEPSTAPASDPIARLLGQAYVALTQTVSPRNEARLRELVYTFVKRMRAASVPPERVVVAVKEAITAFGGGGRPPSLADSLSRNDVDRSHAAYRRVFQWTLEAYFG